MFQDQRDCETWEIVKRSLKVSVLPSAINHHFSPFNLSLRSHSTMLITADLVDPSDLAMTENASTHAHSHIGVIGQASPGFQANYYTSHSRSPDPGSDDDSTLLHCLQRPHRRIENTRSKLGVIGDGMNGTDGITYDRKRNEAWDGPTLVNGHRLLPSPLTNGIPRSPLPAFQTVVQAQAYPPHSAVPNPSIRGSSPKIANGLPSDPAGEAAQHLSIVTAAGSAIRPNGRGGAIAKGSGDVERRVGESG